MSTSWSDTVTQAIACATSADFTCCCGATYAEFIEYCGNIPTDKQEEWACAPCPECHQGCKKTFNLYLNKAYGDYMYPDFVNIHTQTTTVSPLTTTIYGVDVDISAYQGCILECAVALNSSATPTIYLENKIGAAYTAWATAHPDLTTTANNYSCRPGAFPTGTTHVRAALVPATTTSSVSYQLKSFMQEIGY